MSDSRVSAAERAEEIGELETALALWTALGIDQNDPVFLARAGIVAEELERWKQAEELFERAIAIEKVPEIMASFGLLWSERTDGEPQENLKEAVKWYSRSIEIVPSASTFTLLGATYKRLEQKEQAEAALQEALRLDDRYDEAYLNLGLLYEQTDQDRAAEYFEKTLSLDSEILMAHQSLGIIRQKKKNYREAEYHLLRCVEISPADYFSHLYLANFFGTQGRNAVAEEQYRLALEVEPKNSVGYKFFANFMQSIGHREEADGLRGRADSLKASEEFEDS